jgi:ribose transport system substrate-binding protein
MSSKIGDAQASTGFNTMMEHEWRHHQFRRLFDADSALVQMLRDGTVAALVVQDPFRMGYEGVKTALAASRNERVPTQVDTDAGRVTKANMNSPRSRELLGLKIN